MNGSAFSPQMEMAILVGVWLTSVGVWIVLLGRKRRGFKVLEIQPRPPVPWGGIDVVLVYIVHVLLVGLFVSLAVRILGNPVGPVGDVVKDSMGHPITRLIIEGGPGYFWMAAISAVIMAPIVEELMFRVLLQGWLEAWQRRVRRQERLATQSEPSDALRAWIAALGPVGPIVASAFLFALVHLRGPGGTVSPEFLMAALAGDNLAGLATLAFALVWLRLRCRVTAADLGWDLRRLPADIGRGVVGFLVVVGPVLSIQTVAAILFESWKIRLAPDPLALFPFALALGTIYFRTHRIMPVIAAHAALNATTLAMLWCVVRFGGQP